VIDRLVASFIPGKDGNGIFIEQVNKRSPSLSKYFGTAVVVLFVLAAAARAAPVHCPEQFNVEQRAVDVPQACRRLTARPGIIG
jgi:hypothetical protein